jgi:repressor LexA
MGKIEEKLNQVHRFVKNYQAENGYPPSVREICSALSIKSTATAHYYLDKLKERGILTKNANKNRAISVCDTPEFVSVPLIGTVTAGTPILAVENLEGYFPLPPELASADESFMLRVKGDSMIEAGIFDKDLILVRQQSDAKNGDIVVALIEDFATVKTFYKEKDFIRLQPENSSMSPIIVKDVAILGKVIGLFRKF